MSDDKKQTEELEYVPERHRLDSRDLPPRSSDVENMLKLCKEMKGTAIEWAWKVGSRSKVFTLKAKYPRFKVREYWDYEQRDDPTWTLTDNREHGNNLIWQQKTCDCDLVLAIVETQGQRTETQEFTVDLTHVMPLLTPIQPVFVELIAIDNAVNQGHTQIYSSITGFAQSYFTGLLEISTLNQSGKIWFENGQPVHATTPRSVGDISLIEMITWQLGNSAYINHEIADARTINSSLEFLINEGLALLEQKRYLATSGLAYECWLIRSGREPTMNAHGEDPHLKKAILDYLRKPSTLLDMLRDMELGEWQWIPALFHLLNQNLIVIKPPTHERSMALKTLRINKASIGDRAGHFMSPKTGLYRYETLMLLLAREFRRFQLHRSPLSLVCMQIRTGEGGRERPQWLSPQAVQIVQQRVDFLKRPADLFTHFEIMDYALLMPDTTVKKALVVAANIQQALSNIVVDAAGTQLTVSCGVAGLPEHGTDLEALVKTAKGAMYQAKILNVPLLAGLLPDVPTGVPEKLASTYVAPNESQTDTISFETLLLKAEVISKEDLANALALVKQMHMPLGRVLTMHGINIPERVVHAAEEIQSLVEKHEVSPDDGVKALVLIDNSDLAVDAAFRRLRIVKQQTKTNIPSEVLVRSGLISEQDLKQRNRESLSTGLPLGYLLAHQELISRALLHDILDSIRLLQKGVIRRPDVLQVVQMLRQGTTSLREICASQNWSTAELDTVGIGELLVEAGSMSEADLLTAREIAITDDCDLESVIVENGYAPAEGVEKAKSLRDKIEKENLQLDQAADILKQHTTKNSSPVDTAAPTVSLEPAAASSPPNQSIKATQANFPRPEVPARDRALMRQAGDMTLPLHHSKPSSQASRPDPVQSELPKKEIDRVDLLILAGLVNDQQASGARKLSASTNTSPLRILFDRGMIDQQTLNLAGVAKRKIDSGDLDAKIAVAIIKYCKEKNVEFDAGQTAIDKK